MYLSRGVWHDQDYRVLEAQSHLLGEQTHKRMIILGSASKTKCAKKTEFYTQKVDGHTGVVCVSPGKYLAMVSKI